MQKRLIECLVLILMILIMAQGASAQQKASHAGQTLRVATWGGAWQDIRHKLVGQPLEKATGARVEWVLGNPTDHLAKMIAARGSEPPFDVAELGSIETFQAGQAGFIERIDQNLLPNIKKLLPEMVRTDAVGFLASEYVNAYLPSKFKDLGLPPPTRMEDLFHPRLANKVALPFVGGSTTGPRFLVTLATDKGGSISNIKPALDRLKDVKVAYYYRATAELEMRMLAGEIWAAYWTISRPFLHKFGGKDMDWAPVGPGAKKATNSVSMLVITKGSKKKELAHMYMDYSLDLNAQYGMAEWGGIRPVTEEGLKKVVSSSNANMKRVGDIPWRDVFTICFPPEVEIAANNLGKWVDQFNREVGAK